jgi:ABC-type multidrug transport system permease subunit
VPAVTSRSNDEPEEPPVMPTADEAAATHRPPAERPAPVRYAFVVWVLAGLVGIVNAVIMLLNKQTLIDYSIKQNRDPKISAAQIASTANTLLWMFLVGAVVFAVFFALFAYKAQDGVRRARLLLTMLCLVTVAFYFLVLGTVPGVMVALLTLIASVLLYLPSSNRFFAPRDLPT